MVRLFFCIHFLIALVGCGKKDFPDYSGKEHIFYEETEGLFDVDFKFLNKPSGRRFKVTSSMWIRGNQFYVSVNVENAPNKLRFQQFIHKGFRCPDQRDDQNGDGKIDISEVMEASGEILIPLDSYIQEQLKGNDWYPSANKKGKYYYSRAASVSRLMEDLYKKDEIPGDGMAKLLPDEELSLGRRVLVIYGSRENPLFPVACGIIRHKEFPE
jgi:hypothetical protein